MYVGTHTKRDFAKGDERQILTIKAESQKKKETKQSQHNYNMPLTEKK